MFLVIGGLSMMSHHYTLGNIKSRTVGDGQHGTARWATDKEIKQTYAHVPFKVRVAQRTESPHGAGIGPRLQGATAGAHRTGG